MNYYSLVLKGVPVKAGHLRALAIMLLTGTNFQYSRGIASSAVPYSLSNIDGGDSLVQDAYNTEFQNTLEKIDKPTVESGDLVVAVSISPEQSDVIKADMDDFLRFDGIEVQGKPSTIFVGLANTSQSDFYTPLRNVTKVVISQKTLADILINDNPLVSEIIS